MTASAAGTAPVSTVQARAASKILTAAEAAGVDLDRLYAQSAFDPTCLNDPEIRIAYQVLLDLYEQAAVLTDNPSFGLQLACDTSVRAFDVLGYAVATAPTLGEALHRSVRYYRLWTDGSEFDINVHSGRATVRYRYLNHHSGALRQESEFTLAMLVQTGRKLCGLDCLPLRVCFRHPQPDDTSEHERFFRTRLEFGAEAYQVVFEEALLALPVLGHDASLSNLAERHAEQLLAASPWQDSFTNRVRNAIDRELRGGDPCLETIARHLKMSERTLQRRLFEQNAAHQELVDERRCEFARSYLNRPEIAICEVAYLLGFSEASAFHRAFRRWTGETPATYRRRVRSVLPE